MDQITPSLCHPLASFTNFVHTKDDVFLGANTTKVINAAGKKIMWMMPPTISTGARSRRA